jgi:alkanesulfonate monooxygenase SsuD/methylene tetrahydromethanopterin reductase-like flavin-dependent oxidoreductase (luciferase family)
VRVGILNVGVIRAPGDTRPLAELYSDALDRVAKVEQLGYDFLFIGEHHFMDSQWNPSPLPLLGSMFARTSIMRLGTNVLLTPLYNPLRLAEDIAVLDNIARGRLDLICGSASITREFETFGVDPTTRFGRVWETMSFLRHSFSEDRVDHKGKYYTFPNVRLTTKPVQQPFPLWFGGFGPKMIARAAKEGYHFFGNRNLEIYLEGLEANGRNVDDFNIGHGGGGSITVVATEAEAAAVRERAEREAAAHNAEYSEQGRDLAFQHNRPVATVPLVGTPDAVIKALAPTFKDSLFTHFQTGLGSHPTSFELFAKEVAPVLRTWGREPVGEVAAGMA